MLTIRGNLIGKSLHKEVIFKSPDGDMLCYGQSLHALSMFADFTSGILTVLTHPSSVYLNISLVHFSTFCKLETTLLFVKTYHHSNVAQSMWPGDKQ